MTMKEKTEVMVSLVDLIQNSLIEAGCATIVGAAVTRLLPAKLKLPARIAVGVATLWLSMAVAYPAKKCARETLEQLVGSLGDFRLEFVEDEQN